MTELEQIEIHWPEYHSSAMGCGLEDRGIHNRYDAMLHGWERAVERCMEAVPDEPIVLASDVDKVLAAKDAEIARLQADLTRVLDANFRQASCIHRCAAAIGPDTCGTIDGLPKAVKHLADQLRLARSGGTNKATVDAIMRAVSDIMAEASVSYPAGREAGPNVEYDEDELRRQIIAVLPAQPANGAANG